jgi:endonuclease/exonuclease/phosphatase family metal-dependent hydrolase
MRINVFKFECLEGDNSFKKEEYFGRPELMNEYINEFVREKLTEGWTRNEKGEYAYGDMPHGTIDYIFMYGEKGLTAQKFQVDTSAKALSSSDHCPMIAEFILD